jgi:beta-glucosidase
MKNHNMQQVDTFNLDRRRFLISSAIVGAVTALASNPIMASIGNSDKIDKLIKRMTLEEKAGQLHLEPVLSTMMADSDFAKQNPWMPPTTLEKTLAEIDIQLENVRKGNIGMLTTPMDLDSLINAQTVAVNESRLGIPLMFGADLIHGFRTVFPVPIAEAASFEPEVARRTARAVAIEGSAAGHDMTYAPMVDIARDQRWGRVVEGAGEDVLLSSLFAAARVRGFQGDKRGASDSMLACVKHFAAYGAAESGLDYAGAPITERMLHEVYLPPFQAAFDAGAILTMASFNTIDGVPASGNKHLLTTILRDKMGFKGAVMSDYESERELVAHGFASDNRDAARLALSAGCDIGMVSGIFPKYLPDLVRSGELDEALVDQAVRRVLYVKQQAGLFDDPFIRLNKKRHASPLPKAHRELARESAAKSIVLLKNESSLLPLPKSGKKIALIGPFGADTKNLNGAWSPFSAEAPSVPVDVAFRQMLQDPTLLKVVAGCDIEAPIDGGIEAAVKAAKAADVVVLALGESEKMTGESTSRTEITLPAAQMALAEAVAATGKPVVVLLRNGRALALEGAVRDASSIVLTWYLGTEMGNAVADVVFGDVSPAGRLPMSFPIASGQQPYYYARENSGRPALNGSTGMFKSHFTGIPDEALYPFGHGLTYGKVSYAETRCSTDRVAKKGQITVSAQITNNGNRAIEEVVQLYIHDRTASVVQPRRKLVDFRKVKLAAGETLNVSFTLDADKLSFIGQDTKPVLESGLFDVWVAPSATAGEGSRFTLI